MSCQTSSAVRAAREGTRTAATYVPAVLVGPGNANSRHTVPSALPPPHDGPGSPDCHRGTHQPGPPMGAGRNRR
jgi:hypothetical protein